MIRQREALGETSRGLTRRVSESIVWQVGNGRVSTKMGVSPGIREQSILVIRHVAGYTVLIIDVPSVFDDFCSAPSLNVVGKVK